MLRQIAIAIPAKDYTDEILKCKIKDMHTAEAVCMWSSEKDLHIYMQDTYNATHPDTYKPGDKVEITKKTIENMKPLMNHHVLEVRRPGNMETALKAIEKKLNEGYRVFYISAW